MLAALFFTGASSTADSSQVEEQLDRVVNELNTRQLWLDESDQVLLQLQSEIRSMDLEIATTSRQLHTLRAEIETLEAQVAELEIKQLNAKTHLQEKSDAIQWHVQQSYKIERTHWMKDLLAANADISSRDRISYYHRTLAEAETKLLEGYIAAIRELNATGLALKTSLETLNLKNDLANSKQTSLLLSKERYREQLLDFNQRVVQTKKEVSKLEDDRARLTALLTELARPEMFVPTNDESIRAFAPASSLAVLGQDPLTGTVVSSKWPVEGEVQNRFGETRAGGRLRWEGIHIAAAPGSVVRSVATGTVVFADWLQGYGMLLIIKTPDGTDTIYGNCEVLYRKLGDYVEAGEGIALVGQSGGQANVGLYFEVRVDNEPKDPITWLDSL